MEPLALEVIAWLLAAAFCAGFIDSIAGGGGMISLPALLAAGVPPHVALGTNKLQSCLGTTISVWRYSKGGQIDWSVVAPGVAWTALGAAAGTFAVQRMDPGFVRPLVIVLLAGVLLWLLFAPKLGSAKTAARMRDGPFHAVFGLALGAYDGFFGPGTGSFWAMAQVGLLGLPLLAATGRTKVFNLTSNLVSLGVFALGGNVAWLTGLAMGSANIGGAWCGSHLALKRGQSLIRMVFLGVVAATLVVLVVREVRS
jgi:uncharacterized protein